jgi:hypothetical protein
MVVTPTDPIAHGLVLWHYLQHGSDVQEIIPINGAYFGAGPVPYRMLQFKKDMHPALALTQTLTPNTLVVMTL